MRNTLVVFGLTAVSLLVGCGSGANSSSSGTGNSGGVPPPAPVTAQSAPQVLEISNTSYNFGDDLVNNPTTQLVVTITNVSNATLSLAPSISGDSSFTISSAGSCGNALSAGATCNENVVYAPTSAGKQTATLNLNPGSAASGDPSTVALTGTSGAMSAGTVTSTNNPQVALYTITPPFPGTVTVNFGQSTAYGLNTWAVPADGKNPVKIEVAGMLANTQYHMQATVTLNSGVTSTDVDHTFTTGTLPNSLLPLTAATSPGQTPQPGIEFIDQIASSTSPPVPAYATDLSGNVIWTYTVPDADSSTTLESVKLMPDGNVAMILSPVTTTAGPVPAGTLAVLREIDLAGKTIQQVTLAQLNQRLATAGFNIQLADIHHDVTILPNGHFLLLGSLFKEFQTVAGETGPQNVLGDAVIDLDPHMNPVWVWNEFDHLDVNRHPMQFPDWTHTNAVVYSPTDGNIFVSMRHQNWVVKVNYQNGTGDGSILWRLGEGGDFTLEDGVDPTDWNYAQHAPSVVGTNSAGTFEMTMMDNGDDRQFPAGVRCGIGGSAPACQYTSIPIFQINELAKTAKLVFHDIIPAAQYSLWGGDSNVLANGDVEFDLCNVAQPTPPTQSSEVEEVTNSPSPQVVWTMTMVGNNFYRAHRIPSLYPGVQWSGRNF